MNRNQTPKKSGILWEFIKSVFLLALISGALAIVMSVPPY